MLPNAQDVKAPMNYRIRLINRAALLSTLAAKNPEKGQAKYMTDHDKRVCLEPPFAPGDFVFVERPQLFASVAERIASEGHSELKLRRTGL